MFHIAGGRATRLAPLAAAVLAWTALTVPSALAAEARPPAVPPAVQPTRLPTPAHVLVVVLENEDADAVIGSPDAPYLNSLTAHGANFTDAHAQTHPSEPNYLALFSGDTHGVTDDRCPLSLPAPNLGSALRAAGRTFVGYSEDLPRPGYTGCNNGDYARKHSPWVNFTNLPAATNQPLSALGTTYESLPTVAFVTPNLCHDMHDCPVSEGDAWVRQTIDGYLTWAQSHNSLLIVTFDEASVPDDTDNHIATLFAGPMVRPGRYPERIDHLRVLRTIEDMYGLAHVGETGATTPITDVWTSPRPVARPLVCAPSTSGPLRPKGSC